MSGTLYYLDIPKSAIIHRQFHGIKNLLELADRNNADIFLTIGGWDDDIRQIYEIPEIRRYMNQLFNKFPHILYYASTMMNFENMMMMLSCICDVETMEQGDKEKNYKKAIEMYKDPSRLKNEEVPQNGMMITIKKEIIEHLTFATLTHGAKQSNIEKATLKLENTLGRLDVIK